MARMRTTAKERMSVKAPIDLTAADMANNQVKLECETCQRLRKEGTEAETGRSRTSLHKNHSVRGIPNMWTVLPIPNLAVVT
jgi:hypothetical protein